MRASLKWLKDYVEFDETPEVLAEKLTMAGIPVATIEYLGTGIEKVVTGKILETRRHPNADKLIVVTVDVGTEKITIATGATNVEAGQVVPVAIVGAKLPGGMEISETDFRGVMSQGMLCSADELGMDSKILSPEEREGILILPPQTEVGKDIRTVLGLDDVVFEFELTANRPDCFSMLGLAREIAVLTGGAVQRPMLTLHEKGEKKTQEMASIQVDEPLLCPRFSARMFTDVKIGPSPEWMAQRLRAAGMRPISNIVDVTNFVMLEMGQPMHAYDYNLLSRHKLIARRANPGEPLVTLDDVKRELSEDMLVIADEMKSVGIAGVMGGLATEVTAATTAVLLEAAVFDGVSVRKTSRAVGLRSEASGRMERGLDVANTIAALDRAAKLLEEMEACTVCPGVLDHYPQPVLPNQISFHGEKINAHLGTSLSDETMLDILRRLGFEESRQGDKILVTAPSWRRDVERMADLAEEVARIYGYDNIVAKTPSGPMVQGGQSFAAIMEEAVKNVLCGAGFSEIVTYSFTHPQSLDKLNFPKQHELRKTIEILNPITDEFPVMRTTLIGNMLDTAVRNMSRRNEDLRLFEIGAVFLPKSLPLTELPEEKKMLCGLLVGKRFDVNWNQVRESQDFYDAKGAVERVLDALGIDDYHVERGDHPSFHPGKTAVFIKAGQVLATVGEIHPKVVENFGICRGMYLFEMDLDGAESFATFIPKYRSLPKFPAMSRDIAVVVSAEAAAGAVLEGIRSNGGEWLKEVRLFDVYKGEQVEKGCCSLAISMLFQAVDRTLTDEEIDGEIQRIVEYLQREHQGKLRI